MINFEEELEKFQPSMDVDQVEDAVFQTKYEDVTDIVKELMKEMGLPEGLIGIGALALGYPASFPHTVKERKANYFRIIK